MTDLCALGAFDIEPRLVTRNSGKLSELSLCTIMNATNFTRNTSNPAGDIDYSLENSPAKQLWIYCAPVIIVLGLIGNSLSIFVMRRRSLNKMTASTYLTVLALVDSLVLLSGLLRIWILEFYDIDVRTLTDFGCKLHTGLVYFSFQMEAWLLVSVTFERFVAVLKPTHYKTLFIKKNVYTALVTMGSILVLINIHFYWTYELISVPVDGIEIFICYHVNKMAKFVLFVWPWIDLVLSSVLPFALMLYMNVSISIELYRRRKKRHRSFRKKWEKADPAMTAMLLCVTFIFVLLTLPHCVFFVWIESAVGDTSVAENPEHQERIYLIHACTSLLAYVNYAINFALYCIGGRRFRKELHSLLSEVANHCHPRN